MTPKMLARKYTDYMMNEICKCGEAYKQYLKEKEDDSLLPMELNYVKRLCINTENYINTIVPVLEDALDNDTKGLKEILEYLYGKDNTLMVWYEDFENLLLELNKT